MLNMKDTSTQKVPLHQKKPLRPDAETVDEDKILESIDNLDMLLANIGNNKETA